MGDQPLLWDEDDDVEYDGSVRMNRFEILYTNTIFDNDMWPAEPDPRVFTLLRMST